MKVVTKYLSCFIMLFASVVGISCMLAAKKVSIDEYQTVNRLPVIDPDYTDTVVPPNIAPLNFVISESGKRYYVKIYSNEDEIIERISSSPKITIPINPWKKMLITNRGKEIRFDVYVEDHDGQWKRFDSITNTIAQENIDGFLFYRLIDPIYILWKTVGIYQRNLENYDESVVFHNRTLKKACINCHNFANNSPDNMIIHMRAGPGTGMLLGQGEKVVKVDTRTEFNKASAAYASWHPNEKLLAFSVNEVSQFFHATGENRDVYDMASDLLLYDINSNTITTSPDISSTDRMETYPAWTPDGQYLYFCSAPKYNSDLSLQQQYDTIQYDLMRIPYDPTSGTWGTHEAVLTAKETGLSITHPRISPDGRYVLFCMADYGNFSIYRASSDLYLMDLETDQYHKPAINSDRSESYHSWSSNSRWFVFSSKRRDGVCARPYFSYIDEKGKVYKPFLLPQKDPTFYDSFLKTYNVPELVKEPATLRAQELTRAAFDTRNVLSAMLDPKVKPQQPVDVEKIEWQPAPQ